MVNLIFIQPYRITELLIFVLIEQKNNERLYHFLFYRWIERKGK